MSFGPGWMAFTNRSINEVPRMHVTAMLVTTAKWTFARDSPRRRYRGISPMAFSRWRFAAIKGGPESGLKFCFELAGRTFAWIRFPSKHYPRFGM